jgi:hypothetical protein
MTSTSRIEMGKFLGTLSYENSRWRIYLWIEIYGLPYFRYKLVVMEQEDWDILGRNLLETLLEKESDYVLEHMNTFNMIRTNTLFK